jgi:hypothetical protein
MKGDDFFEIFGDPWFWLCVLKVVLNVAVFVLCVLAPLKYFALL